LGGDIVWRKQEEAFFQCGAASPLAFISQRLVFRVEELVVWYERSGRGDALAAQRSLNYYVRVGRLQRVRRGVYAHADCFDTHLVASRLAPEAILGFDGALSLRGLPGSPYRVSFFTKARTESLSFNDTILQPHRATEAQWFSLVGDSITVERGGLFVRATGLERTLVDCVDWLEAGPYLEDLIDAFGTAQFDFDKLLRLVRNRHSPLLASRLGCLLTAARRTESPWIFGALAHEGLQRPDYFLRSARTPDDVLISKWNLIVSPKLMSLYAATLR
jgi:hypothetical protein